MLMGFIGFGSTPPAPPSSDDDPSPEQRPDDTGIRVPSGPRAARSRYGGKTSKVGRYAWAISLGIHAFVLVGAFVAMRYYFRPPPAPRTTPDDGVQNGFRSIVQSSDASQVIQAGAEFSFVSGDSAADSELLKEGNLPQFLRLQPQTTLTLDDLSPASGVEQLTGAAGPRGLPRHVAIRTIAP